MIKRNLTRLFLLFLLLATFLLPGGAAAQTPELPQTTLNNDGEIYTVLTGTYGDLFPDGEELDPDRAVLALEVTEPMRRLNKTERLIVPTTRGQEVESAPFLLYSKSSGWLNVIWESRLGEDTSLLLARFDGQAWSDIEEIFFHPGPVVPHMALTRDAFELALTEDERVRVERHVLHLVWPQDIEGERRVNYSPIIFVEGGFVGWKDVFALGRLDGDAGVVSTLPETLQITVPDHRRNATVVFGSAASGRLASYQIDILPLEFVYLSDEVRNFILNNAYDPENLVGYADGMGFHMIGIGRRALLNPTVSNHLAAALSERMIEIGGDYGPGQSEALAAEMRRFTLDTLSELTSVRVSGGGDEMDVLEIDISSLVGGTPEAPAHVFDVRRAVERSFPEVPGEENALFVSEDGQRALVVWRDAPSSKKLWWTEWQGGAWSAAQHLHLDRDVSLQTALRLFRERVE